ncbi:MAG TPA: fibronectin type III domain-containing protein [Candidatus Nanopelagicales bacterium]|nr:fibronectin type III domain-containing protein [Candidatus Nanopelagicales bacterium]
MPSRVLAGALATVVVAGVLSVIPAAGAQAASHASEDFESFSLGSAAGQAGWRQSNAAYDNGIADVSGKFGGALGSKALRVSNAYTKTSFGDQLFSPTVAQEAGETSAEDNGLSTGPRQSQFTNSFTFAAASPTYQPGLALGLSPDRGDGARMSLIRIYDEPAGLKVTVIGVDAAQDPDADAFFPETTVAEDLSRDEAHTLSLTMDFADGSDDDTVTVSVDGGTAVQTTSWEEYYRLGEGNPTRTVGTVLFRDSIAPDPSEVAGLTGKGVYFDDFTTTTGPSPAVTTTTQIVTPADLGPGGWQTADQATATSDIADGPGNPPLGDGSMNVATGPGNGPGSGNGGKSFVANGSYAGTDVSGLTDLQYDFYRSSASSAPSNGGVRSSINLGVNFDNGGTAAWTTLVYEPVYDTSVTLTDDTWQHADAFSPTARWWSTRPMLGLCGPGTAHLSCPDTFVPWSQVLTALGALGGGTLDAGGVQLNTGQNSAGGPWSNFIGAFDAVTVGTTTAVTTYDFEYGLGSCAVSSDTVTKTFTLLADCETDTTLWVRDGWTVDGAGHTITAITPGPTFTGAVLQNTGSSMAVKNLTVTTDGFAGGSSGGDLAGIRFLDASGSVSATTISGISHGTGNQEGHALDIDNTGGATLRDVTVDDVSITRYQKTGVRVRGNVALTLTNSRITEAGAPDGSPMGTKLASNSLDIRNSDGGAVITDNHITGNDWDGPSDWVGAAALLQSDGVVTFKHNVVDGAGVDLGVYAWGNGSAVVKCNLVTSTPDDTNVSHGGPWGIYLGGASYTAVDNTITGYAVPIEGGLNVVNQGACGPTKPAVTVAGVTASSASVSWTPGAALAYAPVSGWELATPSGIVMLPAGTTTYPLSGLQAGTDYTVSVKAINISGSSAYANASFTTTGTPPPPQAPAAVTGLAASAVTDSGFTLTWNAAARADSYQVQVGATTTSVTGTSTVISGLSAATAYLVKVNAVNGVGDGAADSILVTTAATPPPPQAPAAVTGLAATAVTDSGFTLTWNPAARADSYQVQVGATTTSVTGTSTVITGLTAATAYLVKVNAVNGVGDGGTDSILVTTAKAHVPVKTASIKVSPGKVRWHKSTTVSGVVKADGTGVGGVKVLVSGAGKTVTTTTKPDGSWSVTYKPNRSATLAAAASGYPTATAKVKVAFKVVAKAKPGKVIARVKPAANKVILQQKVKGTWTNVAQKYLHGATTVKFTGVAKGKYRVFVKASNGYVQNTSKAVKVKK